MRAALLGVVGVVLGAAGCPSGPLAAKDVGAALFSDPRFTGSELNKFSCATCHSLGDDGSGAVHAGFDLKSAAVRSRYWGGYSIDLLDATNDCIQFFMLGAPMTRDDPRGRALYEYLLSESAGQKDTAPRPLSIVENVVTVPAPGQPKGDKVKGGKLWDNACRVCHGDPHTGTGRLTDLASIVPEASIQFGQQIGFTADLVVIEKVRHGTFFGVGGVMPPFSTEQLSDEQLADLLAFLGL